MSTSKTEDSRYVTVDIKEGKANGKYQSTELTPLVASIPNAGGGQKSTEKKFKHARYAASKSSGQAATNIALITSNATQLKSVLDLGPGAQYYYFFTTFLIISIVLQVIVGFLLIWLGSREAKLHENVDKGTRKTKKIGNVVLTIVFLVSIINIVMNGFTASKGISIDGLSTASTVATTTVPTTTLCTTISSITT